MFEQWLGSEKRKIDSTKLFAAAYLLHVHQKFTPLLEWAMPCSRWSGEYLFLSSSLLFLYHSSSHPRLLRDLLRCLRNFSMEFHFDRMENVWIVLGDVAQISFLFLPSIFVYSLITYFFSSHEWKTSNWFARDVQKNCVGLIMVLYGENAYERTTAKKSRLFLRMRVKKKTHLHQNVLLILHSGWTENHYSQSGYEFSVPSKHFVCAQTIIITITIAHSFCIQSAKRKQAGFHSTDDFPFEVSFWPGNKAPQRKQQHWNAMAQKMWKRISN